MSGSVIYVRQSLDKDQTELAVARQERECRRVAKMRRIEVADVIRDNSVTASKRGRPGYARLVQLMQSGAVATVLILRIDRLLRLNDELEELIQLVEQYKVKVITVEGDIDLSTPQGRLIARILVSVARSEMEVKGARHKLANQQRAEQGLPHPARRAYGYESDGVTLRPDEVAVLREMASRFLSGWSYNEIAYDLNARGLTTAYGSPFYSVAIRQILTRKRYAGIREHNGVDYPAAWPAVFDSETWARIQYGIKERSAQYADRPKAKKYLLTGLLYCGACGTPMVGMTTRDKSTRPLRRTYRCRGQGRVHRDEGGCGKVSRGAVPLHHFIRELVCARLDSPELAKLLSGGKSDVLGTKLHEREALMTRKNELVDMLADGTLDKAGYKRAVSRVEASLRALDREVEQLSLHNARGLLGAGESVREAWDRQTDGWRRKLLGLLIERIDVLPGRALPRYKIGEQTYYFAPELIKVHWRA